MTKNNHLGLTCGYTYYTYYASNWSLNYDPYCKNILEDGIILFTNKSLSDFEHICNDRLNKMIHDIDFDDKFKDLINEKD